MIERRLMHWLALKTQRPCPECHRPLRSTDSYAYYAGEIYHGDCIIEHFGQGA